MFHFRSEFARIEKIFIPRIIIWLGALLTFLAGYLFDGFKLIEFNATAFTVVFSLISISFLAVLFLKNKRKENFIYGMILVFFDPLCISVLLAFANGYHHIFLFLYILSLLLSGLILGKFAAIVLTAYNAILFLSAIAIPGFEVNGTFKITVILTFFVFTLSTTSLKDYFRNILRYMRIKDKNISVLEFFNIYLINNMQNGLITVDEKKVVSFWNEAAAEILGKNNKEAIGRNLEEIMPALARYCINKVSEHIELKETRGDGHLYLNAKVSPIVVDGEFVGNIIVIEDITKFKEEQKISEQNQKLAAIGRLVAALAHELRNPLASISASVEMLKEYPNDSPEHKKLSTIIIREIDSLNTLICELLDFVKPIQLKKENFNVGDLINETIDLIRFEKNLNIETALAENLCYNGDKNKLKQVFINILKNAIDVLEERAGSIKVDLSRTDGGRINVGFEDNGPGIEEGNLERIFEPFFTTKEKGTGLGLATCQNILIGHGADIKVESRPGKTRFTILL